MCTQVKKTKEGKGEKEGQKCKQDRTGQDRTGQDLLTLTWAQTCTEQYQRLLSVVEDK
jgi:hypothetical protein